MKAQILKIAGVKSEKEFYKKYPSEAAFMKKHGKAFKKAQMGAQIGSYTGGKTTPMQNVNLAQLQEDTLTQITGKSKKMRDQEAKDAAAQQASSKNSGGGFGDVMGMFGGMAQEGANISRAQFGFGIPQGFNFNNPFGMNDPRFGQTANYANTRGYGYNNPGYGNNNVYGSGAPSQTISLTDEQVENKGGKYDGYSNPENAPKKGGGFDGMQSIPILGGIIEGIGALENQRLLKQSALQTSKVAGVVAQAEATEEEETKRKYNTPWDNVQTGEARSPVLGVGTNPLTKNGGQFHRAQNGFNIGGNPTEIQNTYGNGYSIYDDGEYEPIKAAGGGTFKGSEWGLLSKGGAGFGQNPYGGMASGLFGNDGGGQLGGAIGSAFGPVGGLIGQAAGSILDTDAEEIAKYNKETERSMGNIFANKFSKASRARHSGVRKNGGYMNPEYNPQVITMFGDHNADDFADYAHKDQYRAGGHLKNYTPPSERAMEIYDMGGTVDSDQVGDVTIESGGYLEPISWNPHTGGTGFTSKFHGQSHVEQAPGLDHTGIIMRYGGDTGEQDGGYQMAEGGDAEGNVVEAERGEYISERKDGGQAGESAQISGNRRYNSKLYDLGPAFNKEFEGKKVKAIQGKIAADDAKLNKFSDKNTDELLEFIPLSPIDKLKENALIANQKGIDMKYGINAAKVDNILAWQNSANEVIDEATTYHGKEINGDDFVNSGGKKINFTKEPLDSSKSKYGGSYPKAKSGITTTLETTNPLIKEYTSEAQMIADGYKKDSSGLWILNTENKKANTTETKSASALDNIPAQKLDKATGFAGGVTPEKFQEFKKRFPDYPGIDKLNPKDPKSLNDFKTWANAKAKTMGSTARIMDDPITQKNPQGLPIFGDQYLSFNLDKSNKTEPGASSQQFAVLKSSPDTPKKEENTETTKPRFPWEIPVNAALDYLRPSDAEAFDYSQLYPEMYAMADNQLEPVPAQGYQPDLDTPYDISLQDQLNANQADFNALQRTVGYNPAAQSILAGQKYAANSKILGEQMRLNQAQKAGVYGSNRDKLNQAKLTNLGIYDKQYERQAEAKSNTKATSLAALNSMTDKLAKHKLENKTLAVYENMYNYRFGKSGRAKNWNGLQFFDTTVSGAKGRSGIPEGYKAKTYDKNGMPITLERIKPEDPEVTKNGGAFKKNYKNSSVVRAFKNL